MIQGQLDIPLSHNGIDQAKSLAKLLYQHEWNEVNNNKKIFKNLLNVCIACSFTVLFLVCFSFFLQVWSSDLKRSWQTANFLVNKELTNNDCDDIDALLMNNPLPLIQADVRIRERVSYTSII